MIDISFAVVDRSEYGSKRSSNDLTGEQKRSNLADADNTIEKVVNAAIAYAPYADPLLQEILYGENSRVCRKSHYFV